MPRKPLAPLRGATVEQINAIIDYMHLHHPLSSYQLPAVHTLPQFRRSLKRLQGKNYPPTGLTPTTEPTPLGDAVRDAVRHIQQLLDDSDTFTGDPA